MNTMRTLTAVMAVATITATATPPAFADYVSERYYDRAPAGENDRVMGTTFVAQLTSVLN